MKAEEISMDRDEWWNVVVVKMNFNDLLYTQVKGKKKKKRRIIVKRC